MRSGTYRSIDGGRVQYKFSETSACPFRLGASQSVVNDSTTPLSLLHTSLLRGGAFGELGAADLFRQLFLRTSAPALHARRLGRRRRRALAELHLVIFLVVADLDTVARF